MKTRFLFPHKWRKAGLALLLLAALIILLNYLKTGEGSLPTVINLSFFESSHTDQFNMIWNDTQYLSIIIGLLLIGFSKEKIEDEQIAQLRLDSLQWAVYVNYITMIACVVFINGIDFLAVIVYNVLSPLLFFIIRFRWKIYQLNRSLKLSAAL